MTSVKFIFTAADIGSKSLPTKMVSHQLLLFAPNNWHKFRGGRNYLNVFRDDGSWIGTSNLQSTYVIRPVDIVMRRPAPGARQSVCSKNTMVWLFQLTLPSMKVQ